MRRVIECILATDMAHHQKHLDAFKRFFEGTNAGSASKGGLPGADSEAEKEESLFKS